MKLLFTAPVDFSHWIVRDFDALINCRWLEVWDRKNLPRGEDVSIWVVNPKQGFIVEEDALDHFPALKLLVTPSIGISHVKLDILQERGIAFRSLADRREDLEKITAPSEFTFLLLLERLRRPPARELDGKRVGLIGRGRIGRKLTSYCTLFGADVFYYDPYVDAPGRRTLKQIFATCDAVIVCCASTQETRSIINGGLLKRMKPQSILINTARGDIIVERDLVAFAKLRPDVRIAVVVEVDDERQFERGHRYVFTMPEMPWKRKGPAEKPEKWYEKTGRILGSFRSYPRVDNADYEARETNDG